MIKHLTLNMIHALVPALLILLAGVTCRSNADDDRPNHATAGKHVLALGELTDAPRIHPADGFDEEGAVKPVYYDGLSWQGKPTRVFAWLGLPKTAEDSKAESKIPGIVLVHGGGGTAFKEWVSKWNAKGFAAISIAVEGQTDLRDATGKRWKRHDWAGPERDGIYGDSARPLADQWMYHAAADTILANSLLRSLPKIDPDKVGVMGISWGGVITSTVIGIDRRFAFGIPTYGCGNLADVPNQYGRALGKNTLYREVWDPMVRMNNAKLPTLWLSWTGDQHFPLDSFRNCYLAAPGAHMVALLPNMRHGHAPGWNPPDSYAFAESVVQTGAPWCRQLGVKVDGESARISFTSTKPIDKAVLISTSDIGFTGRRKWMDAPADFRQNKDRVIVNATLPSGTTAWFVNIHNAALVVSSDLQETQ